MAEKKACACLFADHQLHDQLLKLEDGLGVVNLAFSLITDDYGMTVEDLEWFVREHNWRSPVEVNALMSNIEWLDRLLTASVRRMGVVA